MSLDPNPPRTEIIWVAEPSFSSGRNHRRYRPLGNPAGGSPEKGAIAQEFQNSLISWKDDPAVRSFAQARVLRSAYPAALLSPKHYRQRNMQADPESGAANKALVWLNDQIGARKAKQVI